MFGATQLLLGSKVSPELEILGMILQTNGGGFLLVALYFLFKRDKLDKLNPTSRKSERTTLIRGEDGRVDPDLEFDENFLQGPEGPIIF